MIKSLFLFCGGASLDASGLPKPLMKIGGSKSLLQHFLSYISKHRPSLPSSITLLCDDGQEEGLRSDLVGLDYPSRLSVLSCGPNVTTFEKFRKALNSLQGEVQHVQFGYPDIFFFGDWVEPDYLSNRLTESVYISAAPLTSRFPRLIVDNYSTEVRGISNYSSPVPANPLHVFGGDLWGSAGLLTQLADQFDREFVGKSPSLEYDFFFWLINNKKMSSVMLHGDRIWVDSPRDVQRLLLKTE